jgi:RimJ/RimL family protein N-acetyltransferase
MELLPLDVAALESCLKEGPAYWSSRGFAAVPAELPPRFVLEHCLSRGRADPVRGWWALVWLMIVDASARVVGSAAFKSFDPVSGAAEIGYGVGLAEQGRGHATETVARLVAAALARSETQVVFGLVQPANVASRRVLEKNGFVVVGESVDPEDGVVLRYEIRRAQPPSVVAG